MLFDASPYGTSGLNAFKFSARYGDFNADARGVDVVNAARHGYWQVSLSARWDLTQARLVGDAHEIRENSIDSKMDIFNNNVARNIAVELKLGVSDTGIFPKSVSAEKIRLAVDKAIKARPVTHCSTRDNAKRTIRSRPARIALE